jgi:hypothetical protein
MGRPVILSDVEGAQMGRMVPKSGLHIRAGELSNHSSRVSSDVVGQGRKPRSGGPKLDLGPALTRRSG